MSGDANLVRVHSVFCASHSLFLFFERRKPKQLKRMCRNRYKMIDV